MENNVKYFVGFDFEGIIIYVNEFGYYFEDII